jgi:hypothetical protein
MARRRVTHLALRTIAAALIAALATGGAWAPAAVPLQCDACRRDLTGNVVCTKRPQLADPAAVHVCCKSGGPVTAKAKQASQDGPEPSPTKCPPCCAPQPHAPAPAAPVAIVASAAPRVSDAPVAATAAVSDGVHESIFHPPRA